MLSFPWRKWCHDCVRHWICKIKLVFFLLRPSNAAAAAAAAAAMPRVPVIVAPVRVEDDLTRFEMPIRKRFLSLFDTIPVVAIEVAPAAPSTAGSGEGLVERLLQLGGSWLGWLGWQKPDGSKPISSTMQEPPKRMLSSPDANDNVDSLIYNRVALKKVLLAEANNPLERIWKTRRLLMNTPRGNVLLYYDLYKDGFAYYCDQSALPYRILNAMAMKYTMMFRCVDFFTDEATIYPYRSPILELLMQEEMADQTKKNRVMQKLLGGSQETGRIQSNATMQLPVLANPFAKLKSAPLPKREDAAAAAVDAKPKEFRKNKFIYMGKINNADFLQRVPVYRKTVPAVAASVESGAGGTSYDAIFAKEVSWSDYKRGVGGGAGGGGYYCGGGLEIS